MARGGSKKRSIILIMFILSLLALLICPLIGMKNISIVTLLNRDINPLEFSIYWNIRLPRVLLAFMIGAVLSLCGMVFQAIFRNPLTTPFTLGVSSGAALGAIIAIVFNISAFTLGIANSSFAAFLGAIISIMLIYALAQFKRGFSTLSMLLAGVAINFFFSSLILFLQYLTDFTKVFQTYRWLMGSIDAFGFGKVVSILPFFAIGSLAIALFKNELNLILLGEDIAISRGLDTNRFKIEMFIICSLMVGAAVSLCGVIGFVGMVAPHISRLLVGSDHKYLTKASFLFGGLFLVICDAVSRKILPPAELPIGIITALLGGPFFIWLLVRRNYKIEGLWIMYNIMDGFNLKSSLKCK